MSIGGVERQCEEVDDEVDDEDVDLYGCCLVFASKRQIMIASMLLIFIAM